MLQTLVKSAARLCNADRANITRERNGAFYRAEGYGFSREFQEYAREAPIKPDRGSAFGRALLEGRAIHIPDVLSDPEYTYLEGQRLGAYRTVLAVPMLRDEGCTGVLSLTRSDVRPFTEKQVELATTFADQAAIAIENARLFDEVQARTREVQEALKFQTGTSAVFSVMSRSLTDASPVFQEIVVNAAKLCGAIMSNVQLLEGGLLHIVATYNFLEEAEQDFRQYYPRKPDRTQIGGRAILSGAVVHVPDVLQDPEYAHQLARTGHWRAVLSVPMFRDEKPIGALTVARSEATPFAEREIELLRTFADQAVIAIENVRLFEQVQTRTGELQESLEYQTATGEVLNVISRSPNQLQPVLDTIVETAGRLCTADFAFVFRLQADGRFHLSAADQRKPELVEFLKRNPITVGGGSLTGRVAMERRTLHVPDARTDPNYRWSEWLDISGFRTFLSVPLMGDGMVTGVIALARSEVMPFSDRQIDLVTTFADQAVIAIENVRLFEEVQARTGELQLSLEYQTATSDVLNVISRSPNDLQPVLDTIVETAARLCEAYDAIITLKEGNDLKIAAHHGPIPVDFRKWSITRGWVTGRAVADRKPVHVDDLAAAANEYPDGHAMALRLGHRTILAVPLLRDDVALGAISIRRTEVRPFSEKQVALLQIFADQAVIAIENVRLFEAVQARTAELAKSVGELRALGEVTQAVNSTLDLETVLDTIVAKAVELSGTDAGAIYVYSKSRERFRLRSTYGMSDQLIGALNSRACGAGIELHRSSDARTPPCADPGSPPGAY